jgi:hypothetical protein
VILYQRAFEIIQQTVFVKTGVTLGSFLISAVHLKLGVLLLRLGLNILPLSLDPSFRAFSMVLMRLFLFVLFSLRGFESLKKSESKKRG